MEDKAMENFGKNLKRIRTNKLLSQEALASTMQMTQANISSWETGRTEPSISDIYKLSQILECTISELTGTEQLGRSNTLSDDSNTLESPYDRILQLSDKLTSQELIRLQKLFKIKAEYKQNLEQLEQQKQLYEEEYKKHTSDFLNGYRPKKDGFI
jgi:transcriptional regulator with XRE-family HTH domain